MGMESLYTSSLGSVLDIAGTWWQNRQNQKNAHEQMDFQKYMYQNRYQMQVADLMAAGLNPMLAYTQSPGSAPSGSMPHAEKPNTVGTFNDTRLASAQEANIRADTDKKSAETDNIEYDTLVKMGMPELIAAQVKQATASAEQSAMMIEQIKATLPKIDAEIKNLNQKIALDKSNVQLNNSLIEANRIKNGLVLAEQYLTNQKRETEKNQTQITDPKARASHYWSAEAGERAANMWKIFSPFQYGR